MASVAESRCKGCAIRIDFADCRLGARVTPIPRTSAPQLRDRSRIADSDKTSHPPSASRTSLPGDGSVGAVRSNAARCSLGCRPNYLVLEAAATNRAQLGWKGVELRPQVFPEPHQFSKGEICSVLAAR